MHKLPVFSDQKPRIFCLDGGTGSELERRGAQMSYKCWSGTAGWNNAALLEEIHKDYLDKGAEIIITNTFATSSICLEAEGMSPEIIYRVNDDACKIAMKVKNAHHKPVAVAGSISHMIPFFPWNNKLICGMTPPEITEEKYVKSIKQTVQIFENNNIDVIFIEEQYEPDRTEWDLKATIGTKLPVWVGIACKDRNGVMCTKRHENNLPLDTLLDTILKYKDHISAIGIMHTVAKITEPCQEIVRKRWNGPIFCYPEIGEYNPPHWTCDRLEPEVWRDYCYKWAKMGCCMIGGCCGVMPDDIEIVSEVINEINEENKMICDDEEEKEN